MRRALKTWMHAGHVAAKVAAGATLATLALSVSVFATPAVAQTAPPPDPLQQLLSPLLQPLAPVLNQLVPNSVPAAPTNQSKASTSNNSGGGGGGGGGGAASIPASGVYYHCAGGVSALSFNRGGTLTTKPLVAAVGGSAPQAIMMKAAPPFPLAGLANFRDDWGEYRSTPCPHLHQGNDIFADFGVPFVAPEAGTVERFGFESTGGNAVYFAGDDGYSFYGAHLESFAPGLKTGVHVPAGTLLGLVGNTGDAMGGSPHLHFQLYAPGKAWSTPEDPYFWLKASLESAIGAAGGVVSADVQPDAPAAVNPGNLVSSVLLAGGHIISQPTVPVLLFVVLMIGTLLISQTRTFRVAADVRRSKAGGKATISEAPLARRPGHGRRPPPAPPEENRPAWAIAHEAALLAAAEPPKPSAASRLVGGVGEAWTRLPSTMARMSAPKAPKGHGRKGKDAAQRESFSSYSASVSTKNAKPKGRTR